MKKNTDKIICTCGTSRDESTASHHPGCCVHYLNMTPRAIAYSVQRSWKKPYFGAVPYLEALLALSRWDERYICDDSESLVAGFLANAAGFKGEVARAIKIVLNHRVNNHLFTANKLKPLPKQGSRPGIHLRIGQ